MLLRGDGVWLNGSMDPSMRLGSVYSTKKKKKVFSNHTPLSCYRRKVGEQWRLLGRSLRKRVCTEEGWEGGHPFCAGTDWQRQTRPD